MLSIADFTSGKGHCQAVYPLPCWVEDMRAPSHALSSSHTLFQVLWNQYLTKSPPPSPFSNTGQLEAIPIAGGQV